MDLPAELAETWERAWGYARTLQSATSEAECMALFCAAAVAARDILAERPPTRTAVEIGTWHGRTAVLLHYAMPGTPLMTVDPFEPFIDAGTGQRTVTPTEDQVRLLLAERRATAVLVMKGASASVASTYPFPVGFLFVDGDHSAPEVDWNAWEPHLVPGAIVAWHDYFPEDPESSLGRVAILVDSLVLSGRLTILHRVESMLITEHRPA